MISRAQAIGFWLAALGAVAALALPVSTEAAPQIASRPGLLVATVATAVLFALAPRWPNFAAAFGIVGAALGCAVTLILLADKDIAGYAGWGFWLLTLATWLGAALGVTVLTALRPIDKTVRRLQDLAIPLLFGAFLIYLWEVVVRGFGVSPVLMPSPSSTAQRIFHSLPTLGEDFVQTFVRSVLSGYAIGCGAGLCRRRRRLPVRLSRARAPAARQFRLGAADRRHRADHGDVVRLRLAVEGGRGRGDVASSRCW